MIFVSINNDNDEGTILLGKPDIWALDLGSSLWR